MGLALITGASAGLGAEFARQLAARGDDLVLVARRKELLDELATQLADEHGVSTEVLPADLVDPAGVELVTSRLRNTAAPVDLLVNNAGFGTYGAFVDLDAERLQRMVQLNVETVVDLARAAAGAMAARGAGGILNVASTAGFQPNPYAAVYGATKAFVRSFSIALHGELRPQGVRVTVLSPGLTTTEFQEVAEIQPDRRMMAFAMEAAPVVRAGLRGVDRGRAEVVPGIFNKSALLMQRMPTRSARALSRYVHAQFLAKD